MADPIDTDALRALAVAATPGPWHWVVNEDDTPAAPVGEPYVHDDGWVEQFMGHANGEYAPIALRTVEEFPTASVGDLPRFLLSYADEVHAADAAYIAAADPTTTLALLDEVDRLSAERDALAALVDWLSPMVATDSRDWASDPTDAMVYEVVFGWGDARAEVEERHGGWPRHPGRSLLGEQGGGT